MFLALMLTMTGLSVTFDGFAKLCNDTIMLVAKNQELTRVEILEMIIVVLYVHR